MLTRPFVLGVLAPNAALRSQILPGEGAPPNIVDADGDHSPASTRARMSWAQCLKRVFAIDLTACPQCAGPLTLLAAIEDSTISSSGGIA